MYQVLLVDDCLELQSNIPRILGEECSVSVAASITEAKAALKNASFHLILLDVGLPDGEGFKLCSYIQQDARFKGTPVIFMSGRGETDDKVLAFSLGADDYIVKPFNSRELRARVLGRITKNEARQKSEKELRSGDLRFCLETQRVFAIASQNSKLVLDLSSIEFKILLYFAQHEEHVLSREQVLRAVWGDGIYIQDRTVDSHISRLRKKITLSRCQISAVHGEGYRFSGSQAA